MPKKYCSKCGKPYKMVCDENKNYSNSYSDDDKICKSFSSFGCTDCSYLKYYNTLNYNGWKCEKGFRNGIK